MGLRGRGVVVIAVAVMVAGCSSDPEPVVTPTSTLSTPVVEESSPPPEPTSDPAPTPDPAPTALTDEEVLAAIPEAAREESFYGAQEFVKFYVQLFPELFQDTGRPQLFSALSAPECTFCTSALENFDEVQRRGLSTRGGSITFPDPVGAGDEGTDGDWLVELRYVEDAIEYLDVDGSPVETDPRQTGKVVALVFYAEDRWWIRNIAFEYDDAE